MKVKIWKNMALHLIILSWIQKWKNFGNIINEVENRFEPDRINLVFKSTFTLEVLCNIIICIIW